MIDKTPSSFEYSLLLFPSALELTIKRMENMNKLIIDAVNKDQNLYEVYRFVLGIDKKLIQKLEFFDEYLSSEIGSDKKSIAFKITIQSLEKTLDEKDLEQIHQNIIDKVSNKFEAKIRS